MTRVIYRQVDDARERYEADRAALDGAVAAAARAANESARARRAAMDERALILEIMGMIGAAAISRESGSARLPRDFFFIFEDGFNQRALGLEVTGEIGRSRGGHGRDRGGARAVARAPRAIGAAIVRGDRARRSCDPGRSIGAPWDCRGVYQCKT